MTNKLEELKESCRKAVESFNNELLEQTGKNMNIINNVELSGKEFDIFLERIEKSKKVTISPGYTLNIPTVSLVFTRQKYDEYKEAIKDLKKAWEKYQSAKKVNDSVPGAVYANMAHSVMNTSKAEEEARINFENSFIEFISLHEDLINE